MSDAINEGFKKGILKNDADAESYIIDMGFEPEDFLEANNEYIKLQAEGRDPRKVGIAEGIGKVVQKRNREFNEIMKTQLSKEGLTDEEYNELVQAYANGRRDEIIKEAVDLIWVSYGLLHLLGIDADEAFGRVYASNQTKIPFEYVDGKVQKGKNYQPPSFSDL